MSKIVLRKDGSVGVTGIVNVECQNNGHDVSADRRRCLRCGEEASDGYVLLKFPVFFSPYAIFGDGLGDLGPRGIWYVTDKRRAHDEWLVVACGNMTDAQAMAHELDLQDARNTSS